MGEGPRHHQRLPMVAKGDLGLVLQATPDRGDVIDVDDGGAVDLPEARRVELVEELANGLADERLGLDGHHASILLVGMKEERLLVFYESYYGDHRDLDPAKMLGAAGREPRG